MPRLFLFVLLDGEDTRGLRSSGLSNPNFFDTDGLFAAIFVLASLEGEAEGGALEGGGGSLPRAARTLKGGGPGGGPSFFLGGGIDGGRGVLRGGGPLGGLGVRLGGGERGGRGVQDLRCSIVFSLFCGVDAAPTEDEDVASSSGAAHWVSCVSSLA